MDGSPIPSAASTCVDEIEDDGCGYVAERDWQMRALLHPSASSRIELPNRVDHLSVDPESSKDLELVVEHREAAWQSYPVSIPGHGDGTVSIVSDTGS